VKAGPKLLSLSVWIEINISCLMELQIYETILKRFHGIMTITWDPFYDLVVAWRTNTTGVEPLELIYIQLSSPYHARENSFCPPSL
jgi:hypothetical protein